MVAIGIDFGNDSCVVAVWRDRRIDIVTNDCNNRKTPSMVAFTQHKRNFGDSAKQQWSNNVARTIFDFKNILSLNLKKKWKFNLLNFTENSRESSVSFEISIVGPKLKLMPCQVLAMSKIKADAQVFLHTNERIISCVIAVPSFFNDQERKSVLMAATIARLDCQFLIKETTAVAINYALYKKFATPVNVIFIDFGQSSIQISACRFSAKQLEVIEEVSELIGGRDIDETLADYFIDSFKIRGANKRSKIFSVQLLHEVEELKKKMSCSVERLPLNFEQLFRCEPISMERAEMEKVCASLFEKIENLMRLCLERSKLKMHEIHSIEMVGGSSRIPIIEILAEKVFGKLPVATMNRDEAVARGCLLKYLTNIQRKGYKINEKPFPDNNIRHPGSSTMKEHVRVFQVHRYLKCDGHDAFNITEDQFIEYVEIEQNLAKYDIDEEERQKARKSLVAFLIEHMKPGGVLGNSNLDVTKKLAGIRMWIDGTQNQYLESLAYWTEEVEKIKNRKLRKKFEDEPVNDCDCATTRKIAHQSDADQKLVKKITFKCDDTPIEKNQSVITNSGQVSAPVPSRQSSRARVHRKDLRSRHRRLNRRVNENQDTGFANSKIDANRNLLTCGQKKKRLNWCCFL